MIAAFTLCQRELVRFYRQKSRIIGVIGSPLIFWFVIGSGLSRSFRHPAAPPEMNYLEFFFPGTITLTILFSSIFSTISIIEDRREGFLQSVLVAPVSGTSIALGKILGGTVLAMLQAILLLVIAPFLGISFSFQSAALLVFVLFFIAFGFTGLGFMIAWKMESTQGFHAIMNLFLIPLWLLSGTIFPASGAASWLGAIMKINPLSYGVAALRQALYINGHVSINELMPLSFNILVVLVFAAITFYLSSTFVQQGREG